MNVDKFGHHIHKRMRMTDLFDFHDSFLKKENGVYDLKTSRLTGIKTPVTEDDVVNKRYLDEVIASTKNDIKNVTANLRSDIRKEVDLIFKNTLKPLVLHFLHQFEANYYSKTDIDNIINKKQHD